MYVYTYIQRKFVSEITGARNSTMGWNVVGWVVSCWNVPITRCVRLCFSVLLGMDKTTFIAYIVLLRSC